MLTFRRIGFMVVLLIPGFLFSCTRNITPSSGESIKKETVFNAASMSADILTHINTYRKSKRLSALTTLEVANEQAAQHSKNMALKKTAFSHNGFEQRIAAISKTEGTMRAAAENVAYGQLSAKEVVEGWINSPGHKKNIEGNYTLTGIGVYRDNKGVIFFTQLFMRRE
nr:CAP domain-containing protein [uncultured Sediminibacterium sp.]